MYRENSQRKIIQWLLAKSVSDYFFLCPTLNHIYELHNKYALAELNTEVQAVL